MVINKIDRPDARPDEVLNEIFDLFVELGAERASWPISRTSSPAAASGYATHDPAQRTDSIQPLLDMVLEQVPGPEIDAERPAANARHHARLVGLRGPDRRRADPVGPDPPRAAGAL